MAMALNMVLILFVLNDLGVTDGIFKVPVNLFPSTRIDAFLSFFISYLLPFILLNYFMIFYKEKYKRLITHYPYYVGKLYLKYFLGSLGVFLSYIIIAVLLTK